MDVIKGQCMGKLRQGMRSLTRCRMGLSECQGVVTVAA